MEPSKPSTALFDVFLRLRPSAAGERERERFLDVEAAVYSAPTHITIKPPVGDSRKRAVERFAFTRVYEEAIGQKDIFQTTGVVQQIQGVLGANGREGRDGLLATLGVTGSGKSHTILGSKSQRGLTQLTLDLLFTQTNQLLADADSSDAVFSSIGHADVSEASICTASRFLDGDVGNTTLAGRMSRAATPAMVRDSMFSTSYYSPSSRLPGAFPDCVSSPTPPPRGGGVFDRLYPSLSKHRNSHFSPTTSSFSLFTRGASKLTQSFQQADSSFLSAPASKRYLPRVSTLPQSPSISDISIDIDTDAEYAILVSMYEVYNDRIFDLLTPSTASGKASPMKRRALLFKSTEASPDRKVVAGLKKVVCANLEEALLVLETGLQERKVAGTGSNSASSRSHGFFCIDVNKRHRGRGVPGPWSSSTMTIVDLAGSERARTAQTTGSTLAEAGKINESLMYLGQCMQMQSDNASSTTPALVPFRQCKLTELLFSNSFPHHGNGAPVKSSQKAIMIVTADPLGDFNATSQILRYSALAREVTVPRIPSVSSTILSATLRATTSGRPVTPSAVLEELEASFAEIARLKEELEITQLQLQEETQRRVEVEASWTTAEMRIEEVEEVIREEVCEEMEKRMELEMRRWRAQRDVELDAADEHVDRKMEVFARGMDGSVAVWEDDDKENDVFGVDKKVVTAVARDDRVEELEEENVRLKDQLARSEREKTGMRSPSKKMRVLKTRKWEGEGLGLGDEV